MDSENSSVLRVDGKLGFIQQTINSADYDVAVKECCTLFELVFKKIFQQAIVSLPYKDRENILELERKIGKGQKGVQDFGFGELVGLFRESKLLDKWSKHTAKDLGLVKSLDFSSIVNLRNRITHEGQTCTQGEANIVYEYLRNLLAMLGFYELEDSINQSFKKGVTEINYPSATEPTVRSLEEKLPKIRKSSGMKSLYSHQFHNESERLKIQSHHVKKFDLKAFSKVMESFKDHSDQTALDLGCASGFVTVDRFKEFEQFNKVIGIDYNKEKIAEANTNYQNDKHSFYHLDIESNDFVEKMEDILQQHSRQQFDLIFSALTIHHLSNPLKTLIKLRKFLKKGGYIILRGSDDGSKLAYPDEQNLVESIIKLTLDVEGVSDRQNGRKLYSQLWKAGFRDIDVLHSIKDTAHLTSDERYALFQESFTYRTNYFKNRLDANPDNKNFREEYEWIIAAMEELEIEFINESFYYQEMDYIAIGKK